MAIQNPIPHIALNCCFDKVKWCFVDDVIPKKQMAGQKGEAVCSETVHLDKKNCLIKGMNVHLHNENEFWIWQTLVW